MNWQQWVLIADIALSGLVVVGRTGGTRHYTAVDAVGAVIESALLIWLVVSL